MDYNPSKSVNKTDHQLHKQSNSQSQLMHDDNPFTLLQLESWNSFALDGEGYFTPPLALGQQVHLTRHAERKHH